MFQVIMDAPFRTPVAVRHRNIDSAVTVKGFQSRTTEKTPLSCRVLLEIVEEATWLAVAVPGESGVSKERVRHNFRFIVARRSAASAWSLG